MMMVSESGDMPAILRDVIITILYKGKGPRDNCDSYRGISLMSHKGKLLERLILNRLKPALKELIPAHQFGFTEKCGTQDAILVSRLLGIDATKRHTGLVRGYIDLTKAYDKVNRELLWKILRLYGIPEEMVVVIIAFHEAARAVLQLEGEISPTVISLNRGLKQGSVLSPIMFNIFFGVMSNEFEKRCVAQTTKDIILGVRVQYNLDNGFMDDTQIHRRKPGMRTATVIDVLYADDCVIFANTIRAMQLMMVAFDEVATLFGMEVAITKTKVVCNNYSKAMEFEAREAERQVVVTPQYNTRGSQELARLQVNDVTLFVPVVLIRGEKLEVVPYFRYLGLLDKDDGALGVEIQARICRMKQRFKEFEGRVFCNTEVSTLPRMQVCKCMVLTNGMYAAEVWNYTRADMDRLEKHYFRLLRSTLFMLKYGTTYLAVLNLARTQGVIKIHPIESYVQRQQLKFLWKILHLEDTALQRIVLHGKLDPQYCQGRGGRQRTFKQCIKEALANFGVTMVQCMAMAQQDWDAVIEGIGMDTAAQQWEARPKASKPIDIEWRTRREHGLGRRKMHTLPEAIA